MMLTKIEFENYKALRNTTLPLEPFTLIVGPNGSGKSTALRSLRHGAQPLNATYQTLATAGSVNPNGHVRLVFHAGGHEPASAQWSNRTRDVLAAGDKAVLAALEASRVYSFHAPRLAAEADLQPSVELKPDGLELAGVLDRLRDHAPERYDALNQELSRCIPEFDHVLFETPRTGKRSIALRAKEGGHRIPARDLSDGTLLALALLTLAHLPEPPPIVGLEEPDHGLHPRLLRDVRDALYRLAYPAEHGETRAPVQVIATTHSPVFLDLFRDHPEQIVIAEKKGMEAEFHRLIDRPDIEDILQDTPLGDAWYSGVLGGVPQR